MDIQDDANIPSLLAAPLFGYLDKNDPIYQNTRRFILSRDNPYYMVGPVLNGYAPSPPPPFAMEKLTRTIPYLEPAAPTSARAWPGP